MAYISSFTDRFRDRARSDAYPQRSYLEWDNTSGLMPAASPVAHPYQSQPQHFVSEHASKNAPKLYVAETAPRIEPRMREDIPTEDALLYRYQLNDNDIDNLRGDGRICTSRDTGSKVIVKRVPKIDSQEFLAARREIAIRGSVSDPSIAGLIEWVELDNTIWTVIEHKSGRSIREIIRSHGPFPEDVAKTAINQLFAGIASLFMDGFAHLRICDETVHLDDEGQLVISDFQYACEYGKERVGDLYAATSEKHAADIYVAPEVFANKTYNARKAVIWSCGVLLYFMTTAQTEKLSNLDHPSFESPTHHHNTSQHTSSSHNRKLSVSISQPRIIIYPSRFAAPSFVRQIIPKMLMEDPRRRAELIEVAVRVPKDFSEKMTRPLVELAWLDYKTHVGPYADLHIPGNESSASSIYSAASRLSSPFRSLLGKDSSRRQSAPVYGGFV